MATAKREAWLDSSVEGRLLAHDETNAIFPALSHYKIKSRRWKTNNIKALDTCLQCNLNKNC